VKSSPACWGQDGLLLCGGPYQRGTAHGRRWAPEIRRIVQIFAETRGKEWSVLPDIGNALRHRDALYDDQTLEELDGIAAGAGVDRDRILAIDLYVYSETMGAGCSQFVLTAAANPGGTMIHGANVDVPVRLLARSAITAFVAVVQPDGGIPYVTATVPGTACGIAGVNAAGVAVSGALLLDQFDPASALTGRRHAVNVRRILAETEDLDAAVNLLREQPRYGAWAVCLSHFSSDQLRYVEYCNGDVWAEFTLSRVAGTNHATRLLPRVKPPAHSLYRLDRLRALLDGDRPVTAAAARAALRDRFDLARGRETRFPTMNTVCRVDNLFSMTWEPRGGNLGFAFSREGGEGRAAGTTWVNGEC
jgi:hypothetical protein